MRLLAQSYAITNWADYAAANNISGWVADNSVPVRCRGLQGFVCGVHKAFAACHVQLLRTQQSSFTLTAASLTLQVCLWTGVTCSPEGRIEGL